MVCENAVVIRLIATDLDGTLLRDDQTISDRTRAALEWAQRDGITVVLVTARPPITAQIIAKDAGVGGLAICSNGAITYDLERDQILRETTLEPTIARGIVLELRRAVPDVIFAFVHARDFACEPAYTLTARVEDHGKAIMKTWTMGDALELCKRPAVKLIARSASLEPEALLDVLQGLRLDGCSATHSNAPFIEIHAPHVNKAWALEQLCAQLGVHRDQVVAFGDAPNDAPMLAWAGHGVAMANAHPRLLEIADEITYSNQKDGVAVWLEKHL
jgi:Cof subfamily protein (haloacid dehalogenase superfamily)